MTETFVPFDFKITKLTGVRWDRKSLRHLGEQLLADQGEPRKSVENRIIICFDRSMSSDVQFLKANEDLLILSLLEIVDNPYQYSYWLDKYNCWCAVLLIERGKYYDNTEGFYYEHPIGEGLREPNKAQFEQHLLRRVARLRKNIHLASNPKKHGIDAYMKLDLKKLRRG